MNEAWIRQYVFLGEKGRGVSYDVEIELGGGGLLNDDTWLQRERGGDGGGGARIWEKVIT